MTKTAISLSVHRLESIFRIEITTNQHINHQSTVDAPHILPRMTPTRIVHRFARRRVVDIARASFSSSSTDRRHGRAFADTMTSPRIVRGVVFDMDGTLCASAALDFAEMRRRTGCVTSDILGEVDSWEDARRRRAYDVIEEMEREALATTTALPGAADVASALDEMGVPRALVTRNAATSVDYLYHSKTKTTIPYSGERIPTTNTHGTGCTLASSIAASLAQGYDVPTAVQRAKAYISEAIRTNPRYGAGHGPLNHLPFYSATAATGT